MEWLIILTSATAMIAGILGGMMATVLWLRYGGFTALWKILQSQLQTEELEAPSLRLSVIREELKRGQQAYLSHLSRVEQNFTAGAGQQYHQVIQELEQSRIDTEHVIRRELQNFAAIVADMVQNKIASSAPSVPDAGLPATTPQPPKVTKVTKTAKAYHTPRRTAKRTPRPVTPKTGR